LQTRRVRIDLIYTEAEREVRRVLEQKWAQHIEMMAQMSAIIREYGLAEAAIASTLQRATSVERAEASGDGWTLVNNDAVLEALDMPDQSAHLILTSIPFSTQYEYSPSYLDFGHTDSNDHFWQQMDFLTPELLRILKPGRMALIHVKDRIVPGGINKLGFQTVSPFHADAIEHFTQHGFAYMGMRTITTDVVRENNQTYRLGWTEQCKDGTKMGVGMPEYLLIFRRPPSDTTNSYADEPVVKDKGRYSRSRWQIDAHGYARSGGNRLIAPEDLDNLTHAQIFQLFKRTTAENVYDYENHVALAEALECCPECKHIHIGQRKCANGGCKCAKAGGRLPVTFMLLQPSSWNDHVWSDVTRMLGMNTLQHAAGREGHLCPLQFDIADRVITQYTNAGETVFDPFGGLGTVVYRALLLGRKGIAVELNTRYWADAVGYCQMAQSKMTTPTLFDLVGVEEVA
jgi:DNA modification methylase